jgi:hypothetical protein
MLHQDCKVGMRVFFGRNNGEKTLGEVVKINPTRAKVKSLESRGNGRGSDVGSLWTVPYSLMTPENSADIDQQLTGKLPIAKANPADAPYQYKQFAHVDNLIMEAIYSTYHELSPEALTCDGELPRHVVMRRMTSLNGRLRHLFGALGRPVSESVAYEWHKSHAAAFSASH